MCDVIPGYACFVCVVMRLRLDKKLFILPVYVLRTYFYVVMLCNVSLNTPIACSFVCFPVMTSSLAKVNKSSGAHFLALFLKFPNFLMFLNIQIDLLILKTYYGQFSLTTKKSLHIIFKLILCGTTTVRAGAKLSATVTVKCCKRSRALTATIALNSQRMKRSDVKAVFKLTGLRGLSHRCYS